MAFKRNFIIKKRTDFQKIQSGDSEKGRYVVVCSRDSSNLKVGFTVSKKVGNAVVRNRCKRRLREIAYLLLRNEQFLQKEYVFIAKKNIVGASFQDLQKEVYAILEKVKSRNDRPGL